MKFVGQAGLSGQQLQQLLVSGLFTDLLEAAKTDGFAKLNRDTVRVALGLCELSPNPYTIDIVELGELTVPYNATIEEMVRAGGYKWSDPGITSSKFSITSYGPRKLYLAHFSKTHLVETEQVVALVAAMGDKELAKVEDLLAVGARPKCKKLQREFPIICLGSSADLGSFRGILCLMSKDGERQLTLSFLSNRFNASCRFLLVQPSLASSGGQVGS